MTATEAQIRAKISASHRDWNQECQALAWNVCNWFGHAPTAYPSANAARQASKIVGTDPTKAPAAAFHYWAIGSDGHVAVGLGGERVLMASAHVDTLWGTNAGVTTVRRYNSVTGAKYLGWSLSNGANDFELAVATSGPAKQYTTAEHGEGLIAVASRVHVPLTKLEQLNPGIDPSGLTLGQKIRIS